MSSELIPLTSPLVELGSLPIGAKFEYEDTLFERLEGETDWRVRCAPQLAGVYHPMFARYIFKTAQVKPL